MSTITIENAAAEASTESPCLTQNTNKVVFPLTQLKPGQCAIIESIEDGNGSKQRLEIMGLCPGHRICMIRRGDPLIIRVLGSHLGLASDIAARVNVSQVETATPYELQTIG